MIINIASTSRPPVDSAVQQSSEPVDTSSQPQILLTKTHVRAVTTTTTAGPEPLPTDIIIRQAGFWSRFWLFLGCLSYKDTADL